MQVNINKKVQPFSRDVNREFKEIILSSVSAAGDQWQNPSDKAVGYSNFTQLSKSLCSDPPKHPQSHISNMNFRKLPVSLQKEAFVGHNLKKTSDFWQQVLCIKLLFNVLTSYPEVIAEHCIWQLQFICYIPGQGCKLFPSYFLHITPNAQQNHPFHLNKSIPV